MTLRYIDGANGNDTWDGLAPNFVSGTNGPKATHNGAEDSPVAAGDIVHVRPANGTTPISYRELLTVDVSGSAGNLVEYRADVVGLIWPNPLNLPTRITGSNDDQTVTRANCVTATTKTHRKFSGYVFDTTTGNLVNMSTGCTDWLIEKCIFYAGSNSGAAGLSMSGAAQANNTIQDCVFLGSRGAGIVCTHTVAVDNAGHLIQRCTIIGTAGAGIESARIGGVTVRNCNIQSARTTGILVSAALTAAQTVTVNNSILYNNSTAFSGTVTGEIVEDYNTLYANSTNYTNTATGTNSKTYPPLYDPRWFFSLVFLGAGPYSPLQVLSPFDLASYTPLNIAGSSIPSTDQRGTAFSSAGWGPLKLDTTLKIYGGIKKSRIKAGY